MALNFPQIGAEKFLALAGPLNMMGDAVEIKTWPGEDGIGIWILGHRADPFQVRTHRDLETAALVTARMKAYELLKGTLQTLELANAESYANILVEAVGQYRIIEIKTPCAQSLVNLEDKPGTDPAYILEAAWTLRATEVLP